MFHTSRKYKTGLISLTYLVVVALCILLAGCDINISGPGIGTGSSGSGCQGNCTTGAGVQGVQVFVEPDAGEHPITDAITSAKKSVWLEIYLLTDRNVIRALEEAAGVKVESSNPSFSLTHEKGMIIDGTAVYIMTSNFSRAALGGSSGSSGFRNREYDIVDTNPQDVQAVSAIFQADWDRTTAQFNDSNLVVSPVNSRNAFTALISSAHSTLLVEAEEMNDPGIEQALANAAQHGVKVQVILPSPSGSGSSSNSNGIATIKQGGVQVREDPRLYMHAKIIVVDGQKAFVGSENISTQSLDKNRELGILVSDGGVMHTLEQTFQQDWGDSQGV
jgi:phosphatidylserine/phosphatidylglycerophosphate/cardiolipin synthase-like enzyme